ncbi:hypothetical protein WJR50_12920 [Catalinimonas sp. 4WD22]|uniref:hypothetical protein n=1 Tax=Catalinimonas locisalis TaxID=3133978 RepID=UPI003101AAB4
MEVLIITGACGVGKSTLAQAWAKLKNGATIECDYLTEWIYKADFPHWTVEEEKFVAETTLVLAQQYLKYGMPVAIENVWSPLGIQMLVDGLQKLTHVSSIKVVWLYCALEENQRRDQLRKPENRMNERVAIVMQEQRNHPWPDYVHLIDTGTLSVAQTLGAIEELPVVKC